MSNWQLQDAKARLSEGVKKAAQEGPSTLRCTGSRRLSCYRRATIGV
jgi:hypothetical protein